MNSSDRRLGVTQTKKSWRKPEVKVIKAGSAEAKGGTNADGQGNAKS
jgi:hypothetical protein